MNIGIVGAGVFGVTGALALRRRGHEVALFDPGPLPHPRAASTDISKVIRMEYGSDEAYMELMEAALRGWRDLNAAAGTALFEEIGVAFLCGREMAPGGFEHESLALLRQRGHAPERLSAEEVTRRFPAFASGRFRDGFYHRQGGFARAGQVMRWLLERCQEEGVVLHTGARVAGLAEQGGRVVGIETGARVHAADRVVLCAGAWTMKLMPWLAEHLRPVGQPVFHLRPRDASLFEASCFPVFCADISETGYYGFPVTAEGIVKIANHGPGIAIDPDDADRSVPRREEERLREFLRAALPGLLNAPIAESRLCLYCDSADGHFWIDHDADRPGVVVASGGSGHAFKFAPILGDLIADVVEGRPDRRSLRFRCRPREGAVSKEEARCVKRA